MSCHCLKRVWLYDTNTKLIRCSVCQSEKDLRTEMTKGDIAWVVFGLSAAVMLVAEYSVEIVAWWMT